MCAENCPGPNLRGFSYTTVANSAVFHECAKLVDQQTPNREGDIPELSSSIAEQPTLVTSTVGLTVVQIIRHSLSECQVPPDIADVIMQSWRTSTQKQYQVYINTVLSPKAAGSTAHCDSRVGFFTQSVQASFKLFHVEHSAFRHI